MATLIETTTLQLINVRFTGCLLYLIFFSINLQVQGTTFRKNNECACSGEIFIYECTIVGETRGATVWRGTAFNCLSQEIVLLHSRFADGTLGVCNGQDIIAKSISVNDNNYTSQLNVTLTPNIAGKIIECAHDDTSNITIQFSTLAPATGPFLTPDGLHVNNADFSLRKLTFSWSPVAPECPAIHYYILASNCGSCPTTTNHTNVTCTNVQTNGSLCTFAVQTVVCGKITGQSIRVTILNPTDNIILGMDNPDTCRVYIVPITVLAAALIVSVVVSITVIIIVIARRKATANAGLDLQLTNRAEKDRDTDSTYEDVAGPLPSASAISTQDNIAYHHTHKQKN